MMTFPVFLIGCTAMAAQIVFMRELLVVFSGNELSVGLILALWLAGGTVGSIVLGRFTDRLRDGRAWFAAGQLILAFALPASLALTRLLKTLFSLAPGQIMPPGQMAASSFLVIFVPSVILGFLFSLGCRLYRSGAMGGALRIGNVSILEALGALTGGLMVSFVLTRAADPVTIIGMLALMNALSAFLVQEGRRSHPVPSRGASLRGVAAAIVLAMACVSCLGGWSALHNALERIQWAGYGLLGSRDSVYGTVTVTGRGGQFSIFDNGLHLYTVPDVMHAEESVHYALLEHPSPRRVLLIGGGAGGLIERALEHPVERLDYVELDPLIIGMAQEYLPPPFTAPMDDPRVTAHYCDGRYFVKNAPGPYDCVIVNLGDPLTAQINRYYTLEFFREVQRILAPGGSISFGLTGSESYIHTDLRAYLRTIYATLAAVYRAVVVLPGERAFFIASDAAGTGGLTTDAAELERRLRERGIDALYVRDYYLSSDLSAERVAYLRGVLAGPDRTELNRDFRPVSYYYATVYWASLFRDTFLRGFLRRIGDRAVWGAVTVCYAAILLFMAGCRLRNREGAGHEAALAVMGAGFTGMSFQVLILLAFQIIYGYLYYKIGLILTAYMVGLAAGGWMMVRLLPALRNARRFFAGIQAALILYPAILPLILIWLNGARGQTLWWLGVNVVFIFLPVVAGFVGGLQFPLAGHLMLRAEGATGRIGGLVYGVDLLGSCLGALVTGAILVPVIGMIATCFVIAGMNVLILTGLFMSRYGRR